MGRVCFLSILSFADTLFKQNIKTKRGSSFSDDLAVMSDYFLWQNSAMFHMVSPRI